MADEAALDLDAVIEQIRAAVAEKTASGVYPEPLEAELGSHYARLLDRADGRDRFDAVHATIARVVEVGGLSRSRIDTSSAVPGGSLVHRAAGKVVSRQVLGIIEQVNTLSAALVPALQALAARLEDPGAHTHDDVVHELDTLQDRLAEIERMACQLMADMRDVHAVVPRLAAHINELDGIAARLARLEEQERRRAFSPTFSSTAFDAVSRGDPESIRAEYTALADTLVGLPGPIVDIGAGRGELLELLGARGAEAWGVELDEQLVEAATRAGLDMRLEDGLDALRAAKPASLGAIVLLHVIEHLQPNELLDVVALAHSRLAEGGRLVLETPNPQSLYVYARAFWLDPTHSKPVHPVYLEFLVRSAGFDVVRFEWTAAPSDDERLIEAPGDEPLAKAFNENVRRLNALVFAPQNYRVVATR